MSRRARAAGFAAAAALCAGLAASATGGSEPQPAGLGELRPALVARRSLPAGRELRSRAVAQTLEVRRVPSRFLPPGVLSAPEQAIGRSPAIPIAAGGYVLDSQFATSGRREHPRRRLDPGRRPVEISVVAAGALAARPRPNRLVDVVVTTEPGPGGGPGRTYVAAAAVSLLELRSSGTPDDGLPGAPSEEWIATLALRRTEALRLIQAESFARQVRLIAR